MLRTLLLIACGTLLALTFSAGGLYFYFVRLPLPKLDGELKLEGLHGPVQIFRDAWGIPHIYAADEHDLFMAQGFVQAQDRLWQMEINRRLAAGRLSEIMGKQTLEMDRFMRTLGVMRAAKKELATYRGTSIEILEAFSQGVNAFLKIREGRLPLEFRILRFRPEPWHPEDSVAWGKVMALFGSTNWQEELVRAMMVETLGPEKTKDLLDRNKAPTPTIIPPPLGAKALDWNKGFKQIFSLPISGASNSWVVDGGKTPAGYPILANDMHLPVAVPSMWYEIHLVGGRFNVIGLSLPGIPLVIAGHNQNVAWGITFAGTDVQDAYLERFRDEQRGRYFYRDRWLDTETVEEEIRIKGQEKPTLHHVFITRHGPVMPDRLAGMAGLEHPISLRWSAQDPGDMMPNMVGINLARKWDDFKAAAQRWTEPPINLVYADRQGNIGYLLASRIPIRSKGHGEGPFQGWTGENEWIGYVGDDQKPFLLNPERGFIVTANNRVVGPGYPYYLSVDYVPGFRAARIEEILYGTGRKFSVEDFRELQGDLKSLPAKRVLAAIGRSAGKSPEAGRLVKLLRDWDQALRPDSVGGAVYMVLTQRLLENTFRDKMGALADRFFGIGFIPLVPLSLFVYHSRAILYSLISESDSPWFDDARTPQRETLADVMEKSLNETAAFLKDKLGPDPASWRWGRLHQVIFRHPLGQIKPLDKIFNIGPYEGSGDFFTLSQSTLVPGMDFSFNGWTVSNRHIYDLSDWDRSLGSIVPGQSGMPGSPFYKDQVKLWLNVKHHPLYYSRSCVESNARDLLLLLP
jgi:penicillin G amidase